jgi:hypothetical protein
MRPCAIEHNRDNVLRLLCPIVVKDRAVLTSQALFCSFPANGLLTQILGNLELPLTNMLMLSKVLLREGSNGETDICGSQLDRRGGEHAAAIILQFCFDG